MALVYCFALGTSNASQIRRSFHVESKTTGESTISAPVLAISCHTSTSGYSLNASNNYLTTSLKDSFIDLIAIKEATEHIIDNAISGYLFKTRQFIPQNRKNNLLFPFHNFW